jgi:hypothetical protein
LIEPGRLEARLWEAANILRGPVDHPCSAVVSQTSGVDKVAATALDCFGTLDGKFVSAIP